MVQNAGCILKNRQINRGERLVKVVIFLFFNPIFARMGWRAGCVMYDKKKTFKFLS
nr:MAG TPA: hypothetical protein [Caudoviricetes sp.]